MARPMKSPAARSPTRRTTRRTAHRGFTLIELMISLVLFSIVIAGVLAVAVSTTVGFRDQRDLVATEISVRAPMEFVADAIRNASPGTPTGAITDVATCQVGAVSITNSSTSPDQLELVYASAAVVTSLRTKYKSGSPGPGPATPTIDVTNASQLAIGDKIVVTNGATAHLALISNVAGNTLTVNLNDACVGSYDPGSLVIRAAKARFFVCSPLATCPDGVPTLMVDPDGAGPATAEPIAENIEDMQISLGVDANGNNGIDDPAEWQFSNGVGALVGPVRAIRVTLTARSAREFPGGSATFVRPAAEDRTVIADPPIPDRYRRRTLTSTIEIRNMGGSP